MSSDLLLAAIAGGCALAISFTVLWPVATVFWFVMLLALQDAWREWRRP